MSKDTEKGIGVEFPVPPAPPTPPPCREFTDRSNLWYKEPAWVTFGIGWVCGTLFWSLLNLIFGG